MNRFVVSTLIVTAIAFGSLLRTQAPKIQAAQPQKGAPSTSGETSLRVPPKSPQESAAALQVLDGFEMQLVASEPLVLEPIVLCHDENGVMFVAEFLNFPYPLREGKSNIARIRRLTDKNGDGIYDEAHVFVDKLAWPTGLIPYKGGLFVVAAPDLWYFKDSDGDHQADVRKKVFTGFGFTTEEGTANNLIWGLDHKIYGAGSNSGGEVRRADLPNASAVSIRGSDFRFDPESLEFEAVSGSEQFGNTFDDWGNRFICSNSNPVTHVVLPARYLARNPYLPVANVRERIWSNDRVFRVSKPEPWRIARTKIRLSANRKWAASYVRHDVFTAATGVTVYRGGAYPEKYRGNLFVGDVQGNLVHRRILEPKGVGFVSRRAEAETEMVRSSDNWFRPANLANAPDGTLYVVDMYREVIETPASLPEEIIARSDLLSGHDRGRIYRLAPPDFKVPAPPRLAAASTVDLVAQLQSINGWHRDTAQRLLYERQDHAAIDPLRALVKTAAIPQGRVHALWALEGLGSLDEASILHALNDDSARVREHAVRLGELHLVDSEAVLTRTVALAADVDARVRFQVAFSLGQASDDRAAAALANLARSEADDVWMRTAILSSSLNLAPSMLAELLSDQSFVQKAGARQMLTELARLVGGRKNAAEIKRLLSHIESSADAAVQRQLVLGLGDGLRRSRSSLSRFLEEGSNSARLVQNLIEGAKKTLDSGSGSVRRRVGAIELLRHGRYQVVGDSLARLLDPRQPPDVQLAAVRALGSFQNPKIGEILTGGWAGYTPAVRGEVVEALLGRNAWTMPMLAAIESGKIPVGHLEPARKSMLLQHSDPTIRNRAAKVLGSQAPSPRNAVISQYRKSLDLMGDAGRGRKIFERECMTCHRVDRRGHEVGPNLATVQNRTPEGLMTQILDPSREMLGNYQQYLVVLDDGRLVTGLITSESPTSVTIKRAENVQDTILRQNIEQMTATGKSLMPEGLEQKIDHQQMADLLAFLLSIKP